MNHPLQKTFSVILISLGLAVVFNFLFFEKLIGVSVFVFSATLLGIVGFLGQRYELPIRKNWWLVSFVLFFSLMIGIRANEFLTFLNICASLGLLMLLAQQLTGSPAFLMKIRDYFFLVTLVPLQMVLGALSAVFSMGQIHSKTKNHDTWIRVIKGIIMAVPILIIFSVLFSQADLAFSQFIKSFIDINISERTIQYTVLLAFAFVSALSFLSYIFLPKESIEITTSENSPTTLRSGREIEILVFLSLISTLFFVFIGFQATYLFGGQENIINAGFTYAEYARRGFFELLAVAILSLLVLLASEKYSGYEFKKDKRFLVPALIMIVEVIVVMVSAFKRLLLYIDAYGVSELRFYVAGFIGLLLMLFIILAIKFIRSKPERFFTFGALLSIASFIIALNIVNPDAFIAGYNTNQYTRTGKIDVPYAGNLSEDAVPENIELYSRLNGEDKKVLWEFLQKQKERLQRSKDDWQSTNLSRSKALRMLQELAQ